ncbi:MAG: mechanosensitive ion channel [Bacteroidia bacterium]|nr:mechanosensitive ion channel [Bacteroidia bacterium]
MNIEAFLRQLYELAALYVPQLLLAIATLIIGFWLIKRIVRLVNRQVLSQAGNPTLAAFLKGLIDVLLKVVLLISVASMVGIETTSFIAVLGAASLAVGLALQGSLANFAGGVLILIFKPFKVGDVIEALGYTAIVKEIQIFHTILNPFDNRVIIVPNGPLANSNITNYSVESERRLDMVFGISYESNFEKAKNILKDMIEADTRIFKDVPGREPFIRVTELADSSVNITIRVWCKASDLWDIHFDMLENVKITFDREGIEIPYPHMEIYARQSGDGKAN